MRSIRLVLLLLLSIGFVFPLAATTAEYQLHKAFKGVPSVEKIVVLEGKDAVYKGETYSHMIVFTVNGLYTTHQGENLAIFLKRSEEKVREIVKVKSGILVFQNSQGMVYDTIEIRRQGK